MSNKSKHKRGQIIRSFWHTMIPCIQLFAASSVFPIAQLWLLRQSLRIAHRSKWYHLTIRHDNGLWTGDVSRHRQAHRLCLWQAFRPNFALETTVFSRLLSSVFTESWWNCTYWYTARISTSTTTDLSTELYLSHWYRHSGGHQASQIVPNLHLLKPPVGHQCQILLE